MKHYSTILFFIFSFWQCVGAQESVSDFLLIRVNQLRESLNLPKLKGDEVLFKAAGHHANYIAMKKKLGHEQTTAKMETVANRIFSFGGNRTYCGENVAFVNNNKLISNKEIADSFFESWKNSPGHYTNMIHPHFTRMSCEIKRTPQGIYAAQVFSSEEISLPKQFNNNFPDWGIKPNPEVCRMLKDNYETMTFANNIQIVDNEVYFFFHDMPFFEAVISDDKDGLAIDVVLRDQLPCKRENQFHISPVYDGQMQKPVYKKELHKNNKSGNPHKMYVKIGEIPPAMRGMDCAVNVIVIKKNFNCDYCVPSYLNSRLYPLLPVQPFFQKMDRNNYFELHKAILVRDTFNLSFHFSRANDKFESYDYLEMSRLTAMLPYVKKVQVDVKASVEGSDAQNSNLLSSRKKTLQNFLCVQHKINPNKIDWTLEENWPLMYEQIAEFKLSALDGKSKSLIKDYLAENPSPLFDSLLYVQRASTMRAFVDTIIVVKDLETLMKFSKYDETFNIRDYSWNDILESAYNHAYIKIEQKDVDEMLKIYKLRGNVWAAALRNSSVFKSLDSARVERYLSASEFKTSNHELLFNGAHFLTQYWYQSFKGGYSLVGKAKTISPEELFEFIKPLEKSTVVSVQQLEHLKFNIHLSGVLYYTAYSNWNKKEKYFDAIVADVVKQNFDVDQAEKLALFFNYFHKFERTVKLLEPYFHKQELSENGIFWLAETATMIKTKLPQEVYMKYMYAAKEKNIERYCNWLNTYFQIQRDENIKQDFCSSCKSSKKR